MAGLETYVVEAFLRGAQDRPLEAWIVEPGQPDQGRVADLLEALGDVAEALEATDDDDEAAKLVGRRRELRTLLADAQDAAHAVTVTHALQGVTVQNAWDACEDDTERRAMLASAFTSVRVRRGTIGMRAFDPTRVDLIPAPAGP